MTTTSADTTNWQMTESGFHGHDQIRLFYRFWRSTVAANARPERVFVYLHRGHEHSGRIQALVEAINQPGDWAFAWDARGHGYSPGARGDAPDFMTLVHDFDCFIRHLQQRYGVEASQIFMVANSVGAVVAATWLHDYAVPVRGVALVAAAFEINLYVPLAQPALRLAMKFQPDLTISSYVRATMLTHSAQEAAAYDNDPLITKNIAARVLLDLSDTAKRIVQDASAIDTPTLMLVASQDFVVKRKPQVRFYEGLSSSLKQWREIPETRHAMLYEAPVQREIALEAIREFARQCYAQSLKPASAYVQDDQHSASARAYQQLLSGESVSAGQRALLGCQRWMLKHIGVLSDGIRVGWKHGFDSGAALDYVYRNQARGRWGIGALMDRTYLNAIGWRGIRQRKVHMHRALSMLIAKHPPGQPIRILDIATGSGRYVLETVKRFQDRDIEITLRDYDAHNVEQTRLLAQQLELRHPVRVEQRDAFDPASYADADAGTYDIVIVSGLYELFTDNALLVRSLAGLFKLTRPGGHLVYTGQPWHPQLAMIALTLPSHRGGQAWVMRPRPQREMDALVEHAGFIKRHSLIGIAGIFTVSAAQKPSALPVADPT